MLRLLTAIVGASLLFSLFLVLYLDAWLLDPVVGFIQSGVCLMMSYVIVDSLIDHLAHFRSVKDA